MKTKILVLAATFSAVLAIAQNPPPPTYPPLPVTPGSPGGFGRTNQFRVGNFGTSTFTNSQGQTFSPEEIESQLVALRGAVEQVLPALNAITEVYSNSAASAQPGGVVGGIAGVLGGVLDRNTNNVTAESSTNTLGRILRDAISAATTNATSTNFTQLRDFVSLQTHLQATRPLFDRLGVTTNMLPASIGGTENNSRTNTGSGKGLSRPTKENNRSDDQQ
ncbi:MAG TPA: hypothetical protein VFZ59_04395 [Verrucomicrobiae bacterium]|nr:hypothetical protein [Verrucomicrobiae bacterium]